jgi:AcrR family transcriptional regulator
MKNDLKIDRRTQRTKKFLAAALIELIMEKGYEAITIQDIINRANVGRSTFYSHYESKEQLLVGNVNFQQALVDIPGEDPGNYPWGVNLSYLFHHTKEHLPLARALGRTNSLVILSNHFADVCATQIYERLKKQLRARAGRGELQKARYKSEAAAGAIIRMLFKWLADGATVPVAEMIDYSEQILHACCGEG